jgi:hypothetical protein
MDTISSLPNDLFDIVDLARLAPSVHNTQPWIVSSSETAIIVTIDRQYALQDGDQTGRETNISLGIFCEALTLAAAHKGWQTIAVTPTNSDVTINLQASAKLEDPLKQIELLKKRHSDRSIYTPTIITNEVRADIESCSLPFAIETRIITDSTIMDTVADLTAKGIGLAMSSPGFRKELSQYLVRPTSKKQRGIATKSLYLNNFLTFAEPLLVGRGLSLGAEVEIERKRWQSASAIVVLLADGDLSKYWFATGQAYLRVSLAITDAGLAQATSAAIVEASNYHEDIEAMLGTNKRILSLLRIGIGSDRHHYSPRVSASELLKLTSN